MKNVSSNTKNYFADGNTKLCKEAHYFIYITLFVDKFQHTLMGAPVYAHVQRWYQGIMVGQFQDQCEAPTENTELTVTVYLVYLTGIPTVLGSASKQLFTAE